MAKKTSYFAKSVIIDGEERYNPGEEIKDLKADQVKRLKELDAITEDKGAVDEGSEAGAGEEE